MPIDTTIGRICLFGFNFAPTGWAKCDGSLLSIAEFDTLFALIGTTYGGDGVTTFALPDLRGRVFLGIGQRTGSSNYAIGQSAGSESVALLASEIPAHTHTMGCSTGGGTSSSPGRLVLAPDPGAGSAPYAGGASNGTLKASALSTAGQGVAHGNLQPYQALNYCIALYGIFPQRG